MIYVRDDDVLLPSSSTDDPLGKFVKVHRWICEVPGVMHIPTILVREIQQFPEAIEYIEEETDAGRMAPELHGLEHIDYGKLTYEECCSHLMEARQWMAETIGVIPNKWYTPWGANHPHMRKASKYAGLDLIDTSRIHKLRGKHGVVDRLRSGEDPSFLEEQEIFMHWWEGGLRLKRALESIKHGSWAKAVEANKGNGLFE